MARERLGRLAREDALRRLVAGHRPADEIVIAVVAHLLFDGRVDILEPDEAVGHGRRRPRGGRHGKGGGKGEQNTHGRDPADGAGAIDDGIMRHLRRRLQTGGNPPLLVDDLLEAAPEHALAVERHLHVGHVGVSLIFSLAASRVALSGYSIQLKIGVSSSLAWVAL